MESFSDVTRRVLEINSDFITAYRETLEFSQVTFSNMLILYYKYRQTNKKIYAERLVIERVLV